jgi:hypothetical protein
MSREHYISASVLRYMNQTGGFKIGGLSWQPPQHLQPVGIKALQSKILCALHNSNLSPLDSTGEKLFRTIDEIDKNWAAASRLSRIDGQALEGWLLKILFGLAASENVEAAPPPNSWKELLTGGQWPELWGLYVFLSPNVEVFTRDLLIELRKHPQTNVILGGMFRVAGVTLFLLLGRPDKPAAFGIYQPRGLIVRRGEDERRIEFIWPFRTEAAVIYTSAGPPTKDKPPHHNGWTE